jgi:hypothetical protein
MDVFLAVRPLNVLFDQIYCDTGLLVESPQVTTLSAILLDIFHLFHIIHGIFSTSPRSDLLYAEVSLFAQRSPTLDRQHNFSLTVRCWYLHSRPMLEDGSMQSGRNV